MRLLSPGVFGFTSRQQPFPPHAALHSDATVVQILMQVHPAKSPGLHTGVVWPDCYSHSWEMAGFMHVYTLPKKKVTRILRFSHNDIWYHAMRKRQHPERLSLQGFNIARGLLDTCRQSQRKFNIVVLRLPPSSSREITLSPILSACKELAFKQTPQVSELSMSFRQTECTPKINVIVFSPELLPSGGTMQKQ